jgi:hypothetical protein
MTSQKNNSPSNKAACLGLFICLYLCGVSFAQGDDVNYYGGGTGEPNDPFQIWTPEQFIAINAHSEDWGRCFRLMADVNLVDVEAALIAPIGNHVVPFSGVFDGNKFAIENVVLDHASLNDVGVFGVVGLLDVKERLDPDGLGEHYVFDYESHVYDPHESVVHIRNVRLVNVRMAGSYHVGALAGRCFGGIENCRIEGGTLAYPDQNLGSTYSDAVPEYFYDSQFSVREYSLRKGSTGGITGHLLAGKLVRCDANSVEISGERFAGGLVGFSDESHIEGCSFKGSVTSRLFAGGLVGNMQLCQVRKSSADAEVVGKRRNGGLSGIASGSMIIQCRTTGQVQGNDNLGGLIGYSYGSLISDCYAQCDVIPTSLGRGIQLGDQGGFVGTSLNDSIVRCYCVGRIEREFFPCDSNHGLRGGAFIGNRSFVDFERQLIRASFWDRDVSGLEVGISYEMSYTDNNFPIDEVMPLSTEEMTSQETFTNEGWDFDSVWAIDEGMEYPVLQWEFAE